MDKRDRDGITPAALRDRPELTIWQVGYFNAFQKVTSSRNVSMSGPLPIPGSEIESHCNLYKIHDVEKIETLHDRISFLDGVYLDYVAKKSKKK